ncbi:MAG: diguanylate cyclase [Luteimonas sp.]|nr:diguanylate cyclase [Luteimonas sp.]
MRARHARVRFIRSCNLFDTRLRIQGDAVDDDKLHWVVTLNRRNRTVFFALLFPVMATHLLAVGGSRATWALLALQLLAYPHFAYWRAARARVPLRAEMQNLLLDGVLLGMWMAAWGLPLWISFMLFIGVCLNVVIYMGIPGMWKGLLAIAAGVAAVALARGGLALHPQTTLATSLLCILLLTLYLLFFAQGAYERGVSLRESRRQLGERLEEITALQVQMQEQALRDPLTGLYNRRYLDQTLQQALADCVARDTPLALVLIDIDRFKRINDTYGHQAGDEMIRRLGALLSARVRDAGLVVCRYGGEEFLLMLPGTDTEGAAALAEELRIAFESMEVTVGGRSMRTTLSSGVAGFPEHPAHPQLLVRLADQALYKAKLGGRNRVVVSTETATAPLDA